MPSQAVFTTALEVGLDTFVFGPAKGDLRNEWEPLARFRALGIREDGLVVEVDTDEVVCLPCTMCLDVALLHTCYHGCMMLCSKGMQLCNFPMMRGSLTQNVATPSSGELLFWQCVS